MYVPIPSNTLPRPYKCEGCGSQGIYFDQREIYCETHPQNVIGAKYLRGQCQNRKCKRYLDITPDEQLYISTHYNPFTYCSGCKQNRLKDLEDQCAKTKREIDKVSTLIWHAIVGRPPYLLEDDPIVSRLHIDPNQCRCGHRRYIDPDTGTGYYTSLFMPDGKYYEGDPHRSKSRDKELTLELLSTAPENPELTAKIEELKTLKLKMNDLRQMMSECK